MALLARWISSLRLRRPRLFPPTLFLICSITYTSMSTMAMEERKRKPVIGDHRLYMTSTLGWGFPRDQELDWNIY